MESPRRASIFFILTLLLSAMPLFTAEESPDERPIAPGVQRERVTIVLVDVVVTDRKGRPVMDLRPEEFTLKVDGSPHPIDAVELQLGGEAARDFRPPRPVEAEAAPDEVPVVPVSRKFILFFDGLNSERGIRDNVFRAASQFLEESLSPGDLVMVVGLGQHLKVYQEFTDDLAKATAGMEALRTDDEILRLDLTRTRDNIKHLTELAEPMVDPRFGGCVTCEDLAISFALEDERRTLHTLSSLRSLIAYLHPLKGRKDLVFLTEGIVTNPGDLYGWPLKKGLEPDFIRLSREAAAAQVVINTVNTLGLTTSDPVEEFLEGKLSDSIATFALNTGGQAFRGSNRLEKALNGVDEGSRASYVIAFTPEGAPDGNFHSIEVGVERKKTRVRAKQGFIWLDESQLGEREVLSAYVTPELFQFLPVILDTRAYLSQLGTSVVEFVVEVPEEHLLFLPQGGGSIAQLEVGFTVTKGLSQVADQFSRGLQTRLHAEQFLAPGDLSLFAHRPIPPGEYGVVAVVRDLGTGNIGAVRAEFRVSDFGNGPMAMSSLFMGNRDQTSKAVSLDRDEANGPGFPVPPGRRVFRRSHQPVCACFLYRPLRAAETGEARVRIQGTILEDDRLVQELPAAVLTLTAEQQTDQIPIEMRLSLTDLSPGKYRLRVQAWDEVAGTEAAREVDFTVR